MRLLRSGFTLIEMLIVLAVLAVLALIALPNVSRAARNEAVRAAARDIATSVVVARSAAIQNGRLSQVRFRGDSVAIVQINGDGSTSTLSGRNLNRVHRVTVTILSAPGDTLIPFDPRGLSLPAASRRYLVTREGWSDTVCVFGAGKTAINSCILAQ